MSLSGGTEDDIISVSDSMSLMEEKQANIQALLESLDIGSDSYETGNVIHGMESMLDTFYTNQQDIQHEISDLLESSRHSAVAYEHLPDMVSSELARTKFMAGIIASLKLQIENLVDSLKEATNADDRNFDVKLGAKQVGTSESNGFASIMTAKVGLMLKSVDGLNKLITSPAKQIQKTITTIDSEVVVLANKLGGNMDINEFMAAQRPRPVQKSLPLPREKSQDQMERELGIPSSSSARRGGSGVPREIRMEVGAAVGDDDSLVSEMEPPPLSTDRSDRSQQQQEGEIVEERDNKKHKKHKPEKKHKHDKSELKFKKRKSHDSQQSLQKGAEGVGVDSNLALQSMSQELDRLGSELDKQAEAEAAEAEARAAAEANGEEVDDDNSVGSVLSMEAASADSSAAPNRNNTKKKGGRKTLHHAAGGKRKSTTAASHGLPPSGRSQSVASDAGAAGGDAAAAENSGSSGRRGSRRNSKDRETDMHQLNSIAEATALNERRLKELDSLEKSIAEKDKGIEKRAMELDEEVQRRVNTAIAAAKRAQEQQFLADRERLEREWQAKLDAATVGNSAAANVAKRKSEPAQRKSDSTRTIDSDDNSSKPSPSDKSTARKVLSAAATVAVSALATADQPAPRDATTTEEKGVQVSLPLVTTSATETAPIANALSFDDSKVESKWEQQSPASSTLPIATLSESSKSESKLILIKQLEEKEKQEKKQLQQLFDERRRKRIEDMKKLEQERIIREHAGEQSSATLLEFPTTPGEHDTRQQRQRQQLQIPTTPNGTQIRPFSAGRTKQDPLEIMSKIFGNVKNTEKFEMIRINAPTITTAERGTSTAMDSITDEFTALTAESSAATATAAGSSNGKPQTAPPLQLSPTQKAPNQSISEFEDEKYSSQKDDLRKSFNVAKSIMRRSFDKDTLNFLEIRMQQSAIDGALQPEAATAGGYELPIFDNRENILITRTYKPPAVPLTFVDKLCSSDTPLLTIAEEYAAFLPQIHRTRLIAAAALEDRIKEQLPRSRSLNVLLAALLENMLRISADCDKMLRIIEQCESMVANLVAIAKANPEAVAMIAASVQMTDLYRAFGEVEGVRIGTEMQMFEYRSLFEHINARGALEISALMKESSDFDYCYKFFIASQGKIVEATQRMEACKDRCSRYQLTHKSILRHGYATTPQSLLEDASTFSIGAATAATTVASEKYKFQILELQEKLQTALEEMEDQEVEMVELMSERDKSPDALLFFAMMHDPAYVQNLSQLLVQLKQLKPFVDGSAHVDFVTLRKRMQVCVALLPSLERLCDRYGNMYKKWSHFRLNWFAERKLTGGTADSFNSCPLCFQHAGAAADKAADASSPSKTKKFTTRAEKKKLQRDLRQQHESLLKETQHSKSRSNQQQQQVMPLLSKSAQFESVDSSSIPMRQQQRHDISLPSIK